MYYIGISQDSIEYIQTSKNIIGREKIIDSGRKILADNLFKSGLITDFKSLKATFREINLEARNNSKNNLASIIVSDETAIIRRFNLSGTADSHLQERILEEAKNVLNADPGDYENFYRIIKSSGENLQILYAATPINIVSAYSDFLGTVGFKLEYLTTPSFVLASLMIPMIESDRGLLYCHIASKSLQYSLLDKNGPITHFVSDESANLTGSGLKKIISKIESEQQISIGNIVIFGRNYLDIDLKILSTEVNIKIVRLDDIFAQIKKDKSLDFDSGGIPQVFLTQVIALMISGKSSMTPNFAVDIDKIGQRHIDLSEQGEQQAKTGTFVENPAIKNIPEVDEEILVEYKKTKFNIMIPKIKLIFIPIILVFIIVIGMFLFSSRGKNLSIPFLSQPTLTPSPTIVPTLTPTPAIDPNLKRSDLKVSVQNGTQTAGLAKNTADDLEKLGYKNVGRSNADKDDYDKTRVKIKDGKKNYLPIIFADLKDKTENPTVEQLSENNNFDVIIILGSK